jgi:hypothetical protein
MSTQYLPTLPPVITEHTRLVGVLQQLQVVLTFGPNNHPTLATVAAFVESAQCDFGMEADLEMVIQSLVARDLERQLHERAQRNVIQEPIFSSCLES